MGNERECVCYNMMSITLKPARVVTYISCGRLERRCFRTRSHLPHNRYLILYTRKRGDLFHLQFPPWGDAALF